MMIWVYTLVIIQCRTVCLNLAVEVSEQNGQEVRKINQN